MIQIIVETTKESAWAQSVSKHFPFEEVDYVPTKEHLENINIVAPKSGYNFYISKKLKRRFETYG